MTPNRHDRYFAAQRVTLAPREMACYAPPSEPARRHRRYGRSRIPAFVAGVAVGLALGLAWGATSAAPLARHLDAPAAPRRHIETYERHTLEGRAAHTTDIRQSPCLDRAHFAMSVARAKANGRKLTDVVEVVAKVARESGMTGAQAVADANALIARVWAQSDEPEAAFDREFTVCARGEVGV